MSEESFELPDASVLAKHSGCPRVTLKHVPPAFPDVSSETVYEVRFSGVVWKASIAVYCRNLKGVFDSFFESLKELEQPYNPVSILESKCFRLSPCHLLATATTMQSHELTAILRGIVLDCTKVHLGTSVCDYLKENTGRAQRTRRSLQCLMETIMFDYNFYNGEKRFDSTGAAVFKKQLIFSEKWPFREKITKLVHNIYDQAIEIENVNAEWLNFARRVYVRYSMNLNWGGLREDNDFNSVCHSKRRKMEVNYAVLDGYLADAKFKSWCLTQFKYEFFNYLLEKMVTYKEGENITEHMYPFKQRDWQLLFSTLPCVFKQNSIIDSVFAAEEAKYNRLPFLQLARSAVLNINTMEFTAFFGFDLYLCCMNGFKSMYEEFKSQWFNSDLPDDQVKQNFYDRNNLKDSWQVSDPLRNALMQEQKMDSEMGIAPDIAPNIAPDIAPPGLPATPIKKVPFDEVPTPAPKSNEEKEIPNVGKIKIKLPMGLHIENGFLKSYVWPSLTLSRAPEVGDDVLAPFVVKKKLRGKKGTVEKKKYYPGVIQDITRKGYKVKYYDDVPDMCSKDLIVVVDKAKYLSTWGIDVIAYAQSKDKEEARYPVPLLITRKQEAATEEAAECLNLMKKLDPELIREMSEMESNSGGMMAQEVYARSAFHRGEEVLVPANAFGDDYAAENPETLSGTLICIKSVERDEAGEERRIWDVQYETGPFETDESFFEPFNNGSSKNVSRAERMAKRKTTEEQEDSSAAECLCLVRESDPELIMEEMSEMESKKRKRKTFPCAGCGLLPVNHHWSKCENCKKTKTRRMK